MQSQIPQVVFTKLSLNVHRLVKIFVSHNQLGYLSRSFKVFYELSMRDKVVSSREGSKEKTPQNLTP